MDPVIIREGNPAFLLKLGPFGVDLSGRTVYAYFINTVDKIPLVPNADTDNPLLYFIEKMHSF